MNSDKSAESLKQKDKVECFLKVRGVFNLYRPKSCSKSGMSKLMSELQQNFGEFKKTNLTTLNPIERFWRYLKDLACANKLNQSLQNLAVRVDTIMRYQNSDDHTLKMSFVKNHI